MSKSRGQANHSLYLAKILLEAWRQGCSDESLPQRVLCQAYLPAVRLHLLDAYGWFLLDVTGVTEAPEGPPHSCDALSGPPDGKAEPGEIREFRRLESDGWLAELQQGEVNVSSVATSPGNLAAVADFPDPDHVASWVDGLSACFERMADSLDEY